MPIMWRGWVRFTGAAGSVVGVSRVYGLDVSPWPTRAMGMRWIWITWRRDMWRCGVTWWRERVRVGDWMSWHVSEQVCVRVCTCARELLLLLLAVVEACGGSGALRATQAHGAAQSPHHLSPCGGALLSIACIFSKRTAGLSRRVQAHPSCLVCPRIAQRGGGAGAYIHMHVYAHDQSSTQARMPKSGSLSILKDRLGPHGRCGCATALRCTRVAWVEHWIPFSFSDIVTADRESTPFNRLDVAVGRLRPLALNCDMVLVQAII